MTAHDGGASWYVDAEGWVRSPSGAKLGRVTPAGELWLWDSRSRCERRLDLLELVRMIAEARRQAA